MNSPPPPSTNGTPVPDYNEELLMRFLVGEARVDEQSAIEQRFITDQEFFEALSALEHEMILSLVRGELAPRWAGPLTAALNSSPDRRRHLDEVREMVNVLRRPAATTSAKRGVPVRPWWLKAAAVIVAGVGLGAWWWSSSLAPAPGPVAAVQPTVVAPVLDLSATFLLVPGPTRSSAADENLVRVPQGAQQVRFLAVMTAAQVASVQAGMRRIGGDPLNIPDQTAVRQTPEGLAVSWLVPSAELTIGDYLISYDANTGDGSRRTIGTRYVRVVR